MSKAKLRHRVKKLQRQLSRSHSRNLNLKRKLVLLSPDVDSEKIDVESVSENGGSGDKIKVFRIDGYFGTRDEKDVQLQKVILESVCVQTRNQVEALRQARYGSSTSTKKAASLPVGISLTEAMDINKNEDVMEEESVKGGVVGGKTTGLGEEG
jgi:hypothetical protein